MSLVAIFGEDTGVAVKTADETEGQAEDPLIVWSPVLHVETTLSPTALNGSRWGNVLY